MWYYITLGDMYFISYFYQLAKTNHLYNSMPVFNDVIFITNI